MRADAECIFCKIIAGQVPCFKLFEDDDTFAFMDNYPANDGHCLVLAKDCVLRVARAVNQVLSPVGLNLVQANGPGAHQSVKHFHIHVLPRILGDGLKLNWGVKPGDPDTIAALADEIRARL